MSELHDAISKWRERMSAEEAITHPVLDELTDHLEGEIERLDDTGFTQEERVLIAARRVGAPDVLGRQFMETRFEAVWARRFFWAIAVWFLVKIIFAASSVASSGLNLSAILLFPNLEELVGSWSWKIGARSMVQLVTALLLMSFAFRIGTQRGRIARFMARPTERPLRTLCSILAVYVAISTLNAVASSIYLNFHTELPAPSTNRISFAVISSAFLIAFLVATVIPVALIVTARRLLKKA